MIHLPSFCYSNKKREPDSLALHYISCIYADPDKWDDPQRIWEMLVDLNLSRDAEQYSPWQVDMGNGHYDNIYASYDWMITPEGERIELVPYGNKTWHAGLSTYRGKENCNNFMAGVGLIAAPHVSNEYGFTEGHYRATAELILEFGFLPRVTTHENIRKEYQQRHPEKNAKDKNDVGPTWDWSRLQKYTNHDLDGG